MFDSCGLEPSYGTYPERLPGDRGPSHSSLNPLWSIISATASVTLRSKFFENLFLTVGHQNVSTPDGDGRREPVSGRFMTWRPIAEIF